MAKFYFTYGLENQPFVGGWTEIEAPDLKAACDIFRKYHPNRAEGLLNCAAIYSEEQFKRTKMAGPDGNLHRYRHERIVMNFEREVFG